MFHVEHMSEINITCPVCGNDSFQKGEELMDYFLSKEVFGLAACTSCGVIKTEPAPDDSQLSRYYESDEYLSHGDDQKGLFARIFDPQLLLRAMRRVGQPACLCSQISTSFRVPMFIYRKRGAPVPSQ